MHSLLSFIDCSLVTLNTYQVGLLQVSYDASIETSVRNCIWQASFGIVSKLVVCGGHLRIVYLPI